SPLAIRIEPLGPVRRGATVRLSVTASTRLGFERGEVVMSSSGGTAAAGACRVALRAVPAGGQTAAGFALIVPRELRGFLLKFRIHTEGRGGSYARVVTYNLLPDGPSGITQVRSTAPMEIADAVTQSVLAARVTGTDGRFAISTSIGLPYPI